MSDKYLPIIEKIQAAVDAGRVRLPSFPDNLIKIRAALNEPEVSVRKLAQLIHTDPVLANRVYSLASSAAYGINTENTTLLSVMQKLGVLMVRTTIYNHCLAQLFNDRRFSSIEETAAHVRNRSLEIAGLCFATSKAYRVADSSTALLSGLFHNVGALVILSWLAQHPNLELAVKEQKALITLGQYRFSKQVVEQWNIPDNLKRVVQAGCTILKTSDDENIYAHLVEIAMWVSRLLHNSKTIEDPPNSSLALFNIDIDDVLRDKEDILAEAVRVIQVLR